MLFLLINVLGFFKIVLQLKMWERHKVELKETNSETEETSKNTAEESEHRREVTVEDRVKKKKPMPPRKKHVRLKRMTCTREGVVQNCSIMHFL